MIKITDKMPITIILLVFSYLAPACGIAASVWIMLKYRDPASLIYGFLTLAGSLLLAALIRMLANIGQMIFDIRVDMQNSLKDTQGSFRHAKESADARNEALIRDLQSIVEELRAVRDNFNQMNCDSRDMNQNIHQIRDFFERIERHLDLKK